MMIYAERAEVRARQIGVDLVVVVWCVGAVWIGRRVHALVGDLAEPGRTMADAGGRFAGGFEAVADAVPELPIVGDALSSPFVAAADAGRNLEAAGRTQEEAVAALAFWLAFAVVVALIAAVAARYVPGRAAWVREATAAARLRDEGADLRLFAQRAVANRSLAELRAVAGAVADGDHETLAAIELAALGLDEPARSVG